MKRTEVIHTLGNPKKTQTFQPPALSSTLPDVPKKSRTARISRRDEFEITKLTVLPGETDNNIYPAIFIITAGLSEIIALPYHAVDIPAKALQRRRLIIWYHPGDTIHSFAVP